MKKVVEFLNANPVQYLATAMARQNAAPLCLLACLTGSCGFALITKRMSTRIC